MAAPLASANVTAGPSWLSVDLVVRSGHDEVNTDGNATSDTAGRGPQWVSIDLVVHTFVAGEWQQKLRIQDLPVLQSVLCSFLASLGSHAVEQSRALCAVADPDARYTIRFSVPQHGTEAPEF